jgi:REP-associated tyrosine transposase
LKWFGLSRVWSFEGARLIAVPSATTKRWALALEVIVKPTREHATNNQQTYFVSSQAWQRRPLFRKERWAKLFLETLFHYRKSAYLLHEFVLMPDHFHLLITPKLSLERAVQFIKGGFSYKARKELQSNLEVWQQGFTDHHIRSWADYQNHVGYIFGNPLEKHLVSSPQEYPYSSIQAEFQKDAVPQWLKPHDLNDSDGTAEAVPLQSKDIPAARADILRRLSHRGTNIPK